jgi:hypothetical protein
LSYNHEIIFQDRREGYMKNASCFIFLFPVQKKFYNFSKLSNPLLVH